MKTLTQRDIPNLQENIPLAPHTTIKIGGPARYFVIAKTSGELASAVRLAKKLDIPFAALGGGSNVLVSDSGFPGLVVVAKNDQTRVEGDRLIAEAGAVLVGVSRMAYEHELAGFEFGIGIPGTVGGAIIGNSSNYIGAVSHIVESVRILDEEGNERALSAAECNFTYRASALKGATNVVLEAVFRLSAADKKAIKQKMDELTAYKNKTQKTPFPTSGCMFKNTKIASENEKKRLQNLGLALRYSEDMEAETIPLRVMLEELDMKGFRVGDIAISNVNANFLLNMGHATSDDVVMMMSIIKQRVRDSFGIELADEVQRIG